MNIGFQLAAIEQLPVGDLSQDVVFSTLVFHHLPDHLKMEGLVEIKRVLVSGGNLVLADFGNQVYFNQLKQKAEAAGFINVEISKLNPGFLKCLKASA